MVALPTPFAPMMSFIEPGSFEAIEPLYGAAMRRELNEVLAAVPADQLAIQWDAALEFAVLEGVFPAPVGDFEALVSRMVEIRSEEHTSELQSLMRISYAVFCLKKNKKQ